MANPRILSRELHRWGALTIASPFLLVLLTGLLLQVKKQVPWVQPPEQERDLRTGELLQAPYRRSDLLEDLHTGGWFSDGIKLWLFFPVALIVTGLWITGLYMALVHYRAVRRRARVDLGRSGERVTDHAAR